MAYTDPALVAGPRTVITEEPTARRVDITKAVEPCPTRNKVEAPRARRADINHVPNTAGTVDRRAEYTSAKRPRTRLSKEPDNRKRYKDDAEDKEYKFSHKSFACNGAAPLRYFPVFPLLFFLSAKVFSTTCLDISSSIICL